MNRFIVLITIIFKVIRKVKNWPVYFGDYFNLIGRDYELKFDKCRIVVRPNSVDRWIVTEDLVLDQYQIRRTDIDILNFVDIGGHIGTTVLNILDNFPKAKGVVFEPDSENCMRLKQNLKINGLQNNVQVFNSAVSSSKHKKIKLYQGRDSANFSSEIVDDSFVLVDNFYFGDLKKFLGTQGNLLKIDIEGGEHDFFTNKFVKILKSFDLIILEYHNLDKTRNINRLSRFLNNHNFSFQRYGRILFIRG